MKNLLYLSLLLALSLLTCQTNNDKSEEEDWKDKPIKFNLPKDFIIEDLYQPKESGQGSWVALAEGDNGMFYASDQRGNLYQFKMPNVGTVLDSLQVDSIDLEIGEAHGLLWAFNSLYVAVNKKWDEDVPDEEENGSGVYRLTDTSGDGNLDKIERLLKLDGAGEHGPHNFAIGPSGKDIYFIAGNFVKVPDEVKNNSRLPNNWQVDNLFPPYLDARGHANDIEPPGGWIARFEPDGSNWELIASGFRNPFDLAFNHDGELFTYDADMEWDIGMPWYRPTRICHAVSGAEFGWRSGTGKWPVYYPDALPPVINVDQGSPTGILMGAQLNFPQQYKHGLFIMDWSFGTIYYLDLQPKGSSYTATRKEFLSGKPLPLTDMIAGSDGHLYFLTGGRNLASHLFRLRYTGSENTTANFTVNKDAEALRTIRKNLEVFHNNISTKAISTVWNHLNHSDRHIRYAARVALEKQPLSKWETKFFKEKETEKILQSGLALVRQAHQGMQSKLVNKLSRLDIAQLSTQQTLSLIRIYHLLCIRMGMPAELEKQMILNQFNAHFPNSNNAITHELAQLLLFLDAKSNIAKVFELFEKSAAAKTNVTSIDYLSEAVTERSEDYGPLIREVVENMPPGEAIYYSMMLSHVKEGWTTEMREKFFQWYFEVMSAKGGLSMKPFLENIKEKALSNIPITEQEHYRELSGVYSPTDDMNDLPQPIGPGGVYNGSEVAEIIWDNLEDYNGTLADGKRAYQAALCNSCHRMKGEGSNVGPDLTQVESKFSLYELAFAIVSPNDEISDQYANTLFYTKDGKMMAGRILSDTGETITISQNPYNASITTDIAKANILKKELSPVSPMPPGLLNRLNEKEILDLFAFMLSGADAKHEIYTGVKEER